MGNGHWATAAGTPRKSLEKMKALLLLVDTDSAPTSEPAPAGPHS
ncbi:hypothetical protein ACN28E_35535 [Archangium lansingense]